MNNVTQIVHQFILMGTPEEEIFIDPCTIGMDNLPDIVNDFDFDFNAGSEEWIQHRANDMNLKQFTQQTPIHIMNEPRPDKPLLVLDLDHTLVDFSSKSLLQQQQHDTTTTTNSSRSILPGQGLAATMKRPYMDEFLSQCYVHYDIVIWSQTSWRWLETKLIELGMVSHPGYKFCFVLDKVRVCTVMLERSKAKTSHTQLFYIL
jgi:ubiquitin-like domain-containing CTD phosphatase 1